MDHRHVEWCGALRVVLVAVATLAVAGCGREVVDLAPIERAEDLRLDEAGVLVRAVEQGSRAEGLRAMVAMGRIQDPAFAEPLALVAASGDQEEKTTALFALGQLGLVAASVPPPIAVAAVESALAQAVSAKGDSALVPVVLEALGKLAPAGAAETIGAHLTSTDWRVRAAAVVALFRLRYVETWRDGAPQPAEFPWPVTVGLIARLADEEPEVRWRAAYGFSRFGEARAVEALIPVTRDENPLARLFAVRSLGRSMAPSEEVAEKRLAALVGALADSESGVRYEVVDGLRRLGAVEAALVPAAARLVKDSSLHVRAGLARALGEGLDGALESGAEHAEHAEHAGLAGLAHLRSLLADESRWVRRAAIEGLSVRLGGDWARELESYALAEDWSDAAAAVVAAQGWAARGEVEAARPVIERGLAHADLRVRAAAVAALGDVPGSAERIARALIEDDLAIRGSALDALTRIQHSDKLTWLRLAYQLSPGLSWIELREALVAAVAADESPAATAQLHRMAAGDEAASVRAAAVARLVARGEEVVAQRAPVIEPSPFLGRHFEGNPRIVLETARGEIEIECLAQEAPIHVANFVDLVEKGYYDGLIFHRVVSNFVIQGGDPRGDGWGGPGYTLRDEINRARYGSGTLGMPKAGKDTGGGQIFITHIPTPHLDGNYTVFGQVVRGLDVVEAIDLGDAILRAYRVE